MNTSDTQELAFMYASLWDKAASPPDVFDFLAEHQGASVEAQLEVLLVDQERRWRLGVGLSCDEYLAKCTKVAAREDLALQLLVREARYLQRRGATLESGGLAERYPGLAEALSSRISTLDLNSGDSTLDGYPATRPVSAAGDEVPAAIGRYVIEQVIGRGGFGVVYRAYDPQLKRDVAIKVPHRKHVSRPEDAKLYLAEAQTLASLEHEHIVPVYDVGSTDEFPFFIVSRFVDGTDLARRLKVSRLHYTEAAQLVAQVAAALHYAHKRGVVHRDIKPGNILLDNEGQPFVVDFGLALREQELGKGPRYAGTPSYMSPEQARGEGHRVDGRSDIFSLGLVLYELLSGRRAFRGDSQEELMEQIANVEVRPPRMIDDSIPKELERICLKALSRRASERYTTAKDMAEELGEFLVDCQSVAGSAATPTMEERRAGGESDQSSDDTIAPQSTSRPIKIVPKGLRSFDEHDADFFLELLPGPRDRDGLPESIRFWKSRIEQTDPDKTFSVGLIYGPSGCGKSSLVKAGLLPRLATHVKCIYVEATTSETERRLLNALHRLCPKAAHARGLKETVAFLRHGQVETAGEKLLIVVDQFEQWLHAIRNHENTQLVQALRQCDGEHVQCVVLVRDDFWMAVTRLMSELEVQLLEGQNSAAVDLFPIRHAEKVLAAFGRAFDALPKSPAAMTSDQHQFVKQSVNGLAQDGKIICVRLALFAEMLKSRPWTLATLREVGGTEGVGFTFLEETFSASTAPPQHRLHQKAARAVLKALLPESGTDIKGHMRSYDELQNAAGYDNRREDFQTLMQILDREIRLITPTDPGGVEAATDSIPEFEPAKQYYQLTHDYLVPALRDWLTRKQKETRSGRAELRLADRSAIWTARPENRHLPSLWEYLNVRLLTDRKNWTEPQRKMMGKTARLHGIRAAVALVVLLMLALTAIHIRNTAEASRLVQAVLNADTSRVAAMIDDLRPYRHWASSELSTAYATSDYGSNSRLHAGLALLLLAKDESTHEYLGERLLSVSPVQFESLRELLANHKHLWIAKYWAIAMDTGQDAARRFQTACALAAYDDEGERWADSEFARFVANHLVSVRPSELSPWQQALHPVRDRLIGALSTIYRDDSYGEQASSFASDTLTDYLADDPDRLFDLLAAADERQLSMILPGISRHRNRAIELAESEISKTPADAASEDEKEILARRQANVAVTLILLDAAEAVWPLLRQHTDPRRRSWIIHRLRPAGVDPDIIVQRLDRESDVSIRRALIWSLGTYENLPSAVDQRVADKLLATYRDDPDPGVHGACEWLLGRWGMQGRIAGIDQKLQPGQVEGDRQWYINRQSQTMVLLPGPIAYRMGSPASEEDRLTEELQHHKRIGRSFAISSKEVTVQQFERFKSEVPTAHTFNPRYSPAPDGPQVSVTWYEAARYCNWLSEQESVADDQMCYPENIGPGMKLPADYLSRTGYRLPTEAEWEYACRAGALTSRYYGQNDKLLNRYAWYADNANNHAWPVAGLLPNDFGLFDMLGNVWEWCQESKKTYVVGTVDKPSEDREDTAPVSDETGRVARGGSFNQPRFLIRSAVRNQAPPGSRSSNVGFRVARTHR